MDRKSLISEFAEYNDQVVKKMNFHLSCCVAAPSTPSEDQLKLVKEALKLIQSCPIIDEIDLEMIKENCTRIGLLNLITDVETFRF